MWDLLHYRQFLSLTHPARNGLFMHCKQREENKRELQRRSKGIIRVGEEQEARIGQNSNHVWTATPKAGFEHRKSQQHIENNHPRATELD